MLECTMHGGTVPRHRHPGNTREKAALPAGGGWFRCDAGHYLDMTETGRRYLQYIYKHLRKCEIISTSVCVNGVSARDDKWWWRLPTYNLDWNLACKDWCEQCLHLLMKKNLIFIYADKIHSEGRKLSVVSCIIDVKLASKQPWKGRLLKTLFDVK